MTSSISVDVITICLNSEKTIERTILSIIPERKYINNYIIVDGGSKDSTIGIINKYKDYIDVVISEVDAGISDAFNKGINKSTSDFILLLNSDDYLEKNSLKDVINSISKDDEIVCTNMLCHRNEYFLGVFRSRPKLINKFNSMLHPGALINKKIYESIGMYSNQYKIGMDYDFYCRCYLNKVEFKIVNLPLVNFTAGGVSNKNKFYNAKESFKIRRRHFNAILPLTEIKGLFLVSVGFFLRKLKLKR